MGVHGGLLQAAPLGCRAPRPAPCRASIPTAAAPLPFPQDLIQGLPKEDQTNFRSILTDGYLRVKGSGGSIYAMGDAATIEQPKALGRARQLFEEGDTNRDGRLSLDELRAVMAKAAKEFPHLAEHSRFLEDQTNRSEARGAATGAWWLLTGSLHCPCVGLRAWSATPSPSTARTTRRSTAAPPSLATSARRPR